MRALISFPLISIRWDSRDQRDRVRDRDREIEKSQQQFIASLWRAKGKFEL